MQIFSVSSADIFQCHLVHHAVQRQQLLEDVHQYVGIFVSVRVGDEARERLQHGVLQLLVTHTAEQTVHYEVAGLHGNSELDPGLDTLAGLQDSLGALRLLAVVSDDVQQEVKDPPQSCGESVTDSRPPLTGENEGLELLGDDGEELQHEGQRPHAGVGALQVRGEHVEDITDRVLPVVRAGVDDEAGHCHTYPGECNYIFPHDDIRNDMLSHIT